MRRRRREKRWGAAGIREKKPPDNDFMYFCCSKMGQRKSAIGWKREDEPRRGKERRRGEGRAGLSFKVSIIELGKSGKGTVIDVTPVVDCGMDGNHYSHYVCMHVDTRLTLAMEYRRAHDSRYESKNGKKLRHDVFQVSSRR